MGIIIKQSIKSSIFAYVGILIGFVTTALLMPKVLSEAEVGLIRLITSISILLAQFSNLGFNAAGVRYFPFFRNYENGHNGYLFWAFFTTMVGLFITLLVLFFNDGLILDFFNASKSSLLGEYLIWVIPLTIFTVFFYVFDNYSRFLFDSTSGTILKEFIQRIFILLAVLAVFFKFSNFDNFVLLYVFALSFPTVLLVIQLWQKKQLVLKPINKIWTKEFTKGFSNLAMLTFLSGFSTQVVQYIDQIQVTKYISLEANGIYATMMMFGTVIYMPTLQLSRIGSSVIAEAWKTDNFKTISEVYSKSCLNLLLFGLFLFLCVTLNLSNLFEFLPNYQSGYWVVIWIGLGKLFDMATGLNGVILQTSKYYYLDTLFMMFLIVSTWLLNSMLIPQLGITGSAIATTISILMFNIFRTIFVWWAFKLMPFSWKNFNLIIIGVVVYFVIAFLPKVQIFGQLPTFLSDTPIRLFLIAVVYFGLVYSLNISEDFNKIVAKYFQYIKVR